MELFNSPSGGALVFSNKDLEQALAAKAALAKAGITDFQGFVANFSKAHSIAAELGKAGVRTPDDLIERIMGARPKAPETVKMSMDTASVTGDVGVLSKRIAEAFMAFAR